MIERVITGASAIGRAGASARPRRRHLGGELGRILMKVMILLSVEHVARVGR